MARVCVFLMAALLCMKPDAKTQNFVLQNDRLKLDIDAGGCIKNFTYGNQKTVEFRADEKHRGPALFLSEKRMVLTDSGGSGPNELSFSGKTDTLDMRLNYHLEGNAVAAIITVKNRKSTEIEFPSLSLKLGVNMEMDSFPHWNDVFFPTLLRCEATHFWGYLMNPKGEILVISSPDAAASWHYDYKTGQHRIFTANIDLLHTLPLPERHPKNLHSLKAGEEKTWTIRFQLCNDLSEVKGIASRSCEAPMIDAPLYTLTEGEVFSISLTGKVKSAVMIRPDNTRQNTGIKDNLITYRPDSGIGKYSLMVTGENNKISGATFTVRQPWSWYLDKARQNALIQEPKGGSHTESWYGFFSMFLAQKYFPDPDLMKASLKKFNEIYPLMYDEAGNPKSKILWDTWDITNRIQNTACMVSLLADLYEVTQDTGYLVKASVMCDFLMKNQDSTGAYRNGKTHYTSVVYIAKSFMEVAEAERPLSESSSLWKSRYQKHFASAGRAIDELVLHGDDVQTEGEMTYEDGMIACSYTQISMYATLIPESQRQKYIDAAEYLRKGHRSLSQLLIPDSRMNGGSLRYWESQYDILSFPNLMSSPHGWSAWRIYGLWYLYQLNGNPELIEQIYNAMGSDVQLIDEKTGVLRWAFCVDPDINGKILVKDPEVTIRENRGVRNDTVIGEQYINMISNWYKAKPDTWVTGYWEPDGGCCDNDVHEIFKCLEEVVLTNACVVRMPGGEIKAYNCKATLINGVLKVVPNEKFIKKLNVNNLDNSELKISVSGKSGKVSGKRMITFSVAQVNAQSAINQAEQPGQKKSARPGDADYPAPSPCQRHNEKVTALESGNFDLLLIGNSITETLEGGGEEWKPLKAVWDKYLVPLNAINLGYSGYRTENILWNLQNGELNQKSSPKVAMLLIGTNNLDDQHYPKIHTAEEVLAGTKAIVDLIKLRHPTTKILILRIFICGGPGDQTPYHRKYNRSAKAMEATLRAGELTRQLADGKQVFWLDVNPVFLRPDGAINTDLMPDLIHPNALGAEAWVKAVEPTLVKLMGGKQAKIEN